jgi:hypothetical protein
MLLIENTALNPKVQGDNGYAQGISQHHICYRKIFGRTWCNHKTLFSTQHAWFLNDVQAQFNHFSDVIRSYSEEGLTADDMIKRWNPLEVGRRTKVLRFEEYVSLSIQ